MTNRQRRPLTKDITKRQMGFFPRVYLLGTMSLACVAAPCAQSMPTSPRAETIVVVNPAAAAPAQLPKRVEHYMSVELTGGEKQTILDSLPAFREQQKAIEKAVYDELMVQMEDATTMFRDQSRRPAIAFVIQVAENIMDPSAISSDIERVARAHRSWAIAAEKFVALEPIFLGQVNKVLKLTDEQVTAWTKAYGLISGTMIRIMLEEDAEEKTATSQGRKGRKGVGKGSKDCTIL